MQQTALENVPLGGGRGGRDTTTTGKDVYETKQGNLVTPEAHGLPSHMNKEGISTY